MIIPHIRDIFICGILGHYHKWLINPYLRTGIDLDGISTSEYNGNMRSTMGAEFLTSRKGETE